MDVKFYVQSACLRSPNLRTLAFGTLALAISLGQCALATAEVVFTSDSTSEQETTSTIFITDDSPSKPPKAPASVEGSIVFVEDEPTTVAAPRVQRATAKFVQPGMSALVAPEQSPARGDLKVVANQGQAAAKLTAVRPMPKPQPLKPLAQPAAVQASNIQPAAALEPVVVTAHRDQPGDIQVAVHDEAVAPQPASQKTSKNERPQPSSPEAALIEAYKLSTTAETGTEYTQIVQWCAVAQRHQLKGDQRAFASKLSAWALNRRGQLRAEAGETDLANADFRAALEFNPRNWRALHNRGVSFAQDGAFAEAFDDFSAVIQLNPRYSKAYANRATLYVQAKDLDSAIKDYQLAIEHDDQFATAYVGLGRVYHMLGEWERALEHFTTATEIEPTSPDIICSRGDLQADMGNYGEALADYARTIEIDPEFGHAYRNGAWLLATCPDDSFRDPENAVLGAKQALEYSYGERHVALDTLAAALASNGQFDDAIDAVKQAVDIAPESTKFTYLSRLQLYQENQPFRTTPVNEVAQATYEASDQ